MDGLFQYRNRGVGPEHDVLRVRARQPLPSSLRIRFALRVAALRWAIIAGVAVATTVAVNTVADSRTQAACSQSRSFLLLRMWVGIVTARLAWGFLARAWIWVKWDTHAADHQQPAVVFTLVRIEFLVTLMSILLSTVGFMW